LILYFSESIKNFQFGYYLVNPVAGRKLKAVALEDSTPWEMVDIYIKLIAAHVMVLGDAKEPTAGQGHVAALLEVVA